MATSSTPSHSKIEMHKYFTPEKNTNMPKRPLSPFFVFFFDQLLHCIYREVFRKEFKKKNPDNKRVGVVAKAAGERWKALSESDKAPYVLQAQKLKAEYVEKKLAYKKDEGGCLYDFDESDMSEVGDYEIENLKAEKFKIVKLESDIFESAEPESEVHDSRETGSQIGKVSDENIKKEPEEVNFKTNLYSHLDELEKITSLPLETMLQSSHLLQLQNILKQVKSLPLVDAKLREWCNTFLEVVMVMPKQRIDIQKVLMETEAKAQAIVQLQKEAAHIKDSTLQDLQVEKEYLTSIKRVEATVESLKRDLAEAEEEKALLLQHEEGLATAEYQRVKRARMVHHDLALLIEQQAAIDKIILDGRNAIKNIDNHLNALIVQFSVLKNAR